MSTGFWINQDGLPLQFGTQKQIPEQGGDYLYYGENRLIEVYVPLGATQVGGPAALSYPGIPSSFTTTGTPNGQTNSAGILSMTTMFPLNTNTPVTVPNTSGVLTLTFPQLYVDQIDLETIVAAAAGTGGGTGIAGIGLVTVDPTVQSGAFVQVQPNTGVQLCGAILNAKLAAGMHFTWYADGSNFGTTTPGSNPGWLGVVPKVTTPTTLPEKAYISCIATGGTFSGSGGGGLLKLRVRYNYYGSINF